MEREMVPLGYSKVGSRNFNPGPDSESPCGPKASCTETLVESKKDQKDRQQWSSSIEFTLSCVAMSVGLGNLWRFPFTALENGGGAFLIPYLIVLVVIGRPTVLLEMAIGQFSSSGQVKVWKMSPIFKGVGWASAFVNFCVTTYYCTVSATALYYFFASFQSTLAYSQCNPEWKGVDCSPNATLNQSLPALYYKQTVLQEIDSIENGIGTPNFYLGLCLVLFWIVVFGSLFKGVKSSGKMSYFTALFPYGVLILLLVTAIMLPGAWDGVKYFLTPQFHKLLEGKVWFAAVEQCFYSLSVGFGPVIMNASYNPFRHDIYKTAMFLGFMDTFTSVLSGLTVFAILGHLKMELNVASILEVTTGGSSLAFEAYPMIISKFQWAPPQLFGALFFLMLFTLGCGSTISDTGSIITVLQENFPRLPKIFVRAIVCLTALACSFLYITPGGGWILELVDYFGCTIVIGFVIVLEIVGVAWVYGLNNVVRDIEFMLPHRKIGNFWKLCWGVLIPVGVSILLLDTLWNLESPLFQGKPFPPLAIGFGWALAVLGLSILPACAIHSVWAQEGDDLKEKFWSAVRPTRRWGPREKEIREEWLLSRHQIPDNEPGLPF